MEAAAYTKRPCMQLEATTSRRIAGLLLFVLLLALTGQEARAQVNPQMSNCEEVTDDATKQQAEICSAHPGCSLVLQIQSACATAKNFLNRLGSSLFGRKEINSNDVFDAAEPTLSADPKLKEYTLNARRAALKGLAAPGVKKILVAPPGRVTTYYEGGMKNGHRDGEGVVIGANGAMMRGQFKAGEMHGVAELVLDNRQIFAGQFKGAAKLDGPSAVQLEDGMVFSGDWSMGKQVGPHVYLLKTGHTFRADFDGNGTNTGIGKAVLAGQVPPAPEAAQAPVQTTAQSMSARYSGRGLDPATCQAQLNPVADRMNRTTASAGGNTVLLLRAIIATVDESVAISRQCLPNSEVQAFIDSELVKRANSLVTCRQISSADNCEVSPF